MEARITKLEEFAQETRERLTRIETRLDSTATKEDLHRELHSLSWKLATLCTALAAGVYWIAHNVH